MILLDTAISQNATLDTSGNYSITKRFIFQAESGDLNTLGVPNLDCPIRVRAADGFPVKYAALDENPLYYMTGEVAVSQALENATLFYADAKYSLPTDTGDGNDQNGDAITSETKPWLLTPQNFKVSYPEQVVPFDFGYATEEDEDGNIDIVASDRVCNSAGDRLIADKVIYDKMITFTFNRKEWSSSKSIWNGTVNSDTIKVAGEIIIKYTGLMKPIDYEFIRTYKNNGSVKWEYYRMNVSIMIRDKGWAREFLDVGTRAIFNANQGAEQIYAYRNGQEKDTPDLTITWCSGSDLIKEMIRVKNASGKTLAYETITEPLPLNSDGTLNIEACKQGTDPATHKSRYLKKKFFEYETVSWDGLNLPAKR